MLRMSKTPNLVKEQLISFGANLRQLRQRKNWTLDDLAERSRLSKPFLSRLESGSRQASISAVLTLAQVFGVSIASMFETQVALDPCLIVRKAEEAPREAYGLTFVPLSKAGRDFNLRPIQVTVSPDRKGDQHYSHDGEEWIYVLSGKITLSLAGEKYDLDAGDAIHFDSRLPHRVLARGKTPPEILLVASPLTLERRVNSSTFLASHSLRAIPAMEIENHSRDLSSPS